MHLVLGLFQFFFFFARLLCFPLVSQQLRRYPPSPPLNKGISHLRAASSFAQKLHESPWLESETDAPTLLLSSVTARLASRLSDINVFFPLCHDSTRSGDFLLSFFNVCVQTGGNNSDKYMHFTSFVIEQRSDDNNNNNTIKK